MKDFTLLRTLLNFEYELSDMVLVPDEFDQALDELIYRTIEFDYNQMSEERA